MPGLLRCTCGDYARVLHLTSHARLRVQRAPGIPCALCFPGRMALQNSGASRRGIAESWPVIPGDAKHRTRNLEIPCLVLTHHPGMTTVELTRLRDMTVTLNSKT